MRSAMLKALSSSWVTTTIVMPRASLRLRISSSRERETTGSRPAEGSSAKSTAGSMMTARAKAARLIIPPESSAGMRSSKPASLTISSFMRIMISMVSRSSFVCSTRGSITFSPTVMELKSAPPWKATPIFLLIS